jgi:clan AA aspartic protease
MVISKDYPYLRVKVTVRNFSSHFQALIDTGFDGHLVLPEALRGQLGEPDSHVKAGLADGSGRIAAVHRGGVEIVGLDVVHLARIILLGDECLLGQGIIKRLKITFDHGD